jgi:ribosome-associated protein
MFVLDGIACPGGSSDRSGKSIRGQIVVDMEVGEVVEHLLKSAQWTASRSSGPGGQHRDKASTRAELTIAPDSLIGLDTDVADRLAAALDLEARPLRITVQEDRSLRRNQEIATQRLTDMVGRALAPPPPPRRPTRPSRRKRAARVDDKTRRGSVKRLRRPPGEDA